MSLKAVLFDLDGTLLPMDQDKFVKGYFGLLTRKLAPLGYEPEKLIKAIWGGIARMVKNDGSASNETVFWPRFTQISGQEEQQSRVLIEEFYRNEFEEARAFCGYNEQAARTVRAIKSMGLPVALATNPIFPRTATEARIRWTGLSPEEFVFCTTYENIGLSKPNPAYFSEVAGWLGLSPEECLMAGNDAEEDLAAMEVGMEVFLLTDCLINKKGADISVCPHGSFEQLLELVKQRLDA